MKIYIYIYACTYLLHLSICFIYTCTYIHNYIYMCVCVGEFIYVFVCFYLLFIFVRICFESFGVGGCLEVSGFPAPETM